MKQIKPKTDQLNLFRSINNYYKNNFIDLDSLSQLNFRHFRYRLPNGSFYKVKKKIRNSHDFNNSLSEAKPLDVYYSTATWLNPHIIGSRLDEDILKNIMLSCDLSFDVDVNEDINTLEDARLQSLAIIDYLDSVNIPIRYTAFSGSKGFHIVCDDPWIEDILEEDPRKRESIAVEKRKVLMSELKKLGISFDDKVTIDTRRIIRVPGTINSKTGFACTTLSQNDLNSDLETIFKSIPSIGINAPRISQYLRKMTAPSAYKISGLEGRLGVRPKPKTVLCYSTFYTNNIPKTQLKIPVMEFGHWMKESKIESIIKRVQNQYGLGDVFLFCDETRYWAVSLKAVSQRRVEKILKVSESLNLNQCKKYGCTYTRIGNSIDVDGNIVQEAPRYLETFISNLRGQTSRTHYEFFSSIRITPRSTIREFCGAGKNELEIVYAIID